EGTSLSSMDEALAKIQKEIREIPGVELVLAPVGPRGFGGVNRGELYVRLADIKGRSFSLDRWWRGLLKGDPGAAWRGNFSQRDKMAEVRQLLKKTPDIRGSVRNLTSL